jgi:hypothetical protein
MRRVSFGRHIVEYAWPDARLANAEQVVMTVDCEKLQPALRACLGSLSSRPE